MTPLARYAQALSELTPDTVNHLAALLSEQAVFSDPFNRGNRPGGFSAYL